MIALIVVLVALALEAALLAFWVPSYYRTGPRVFRTPVSTSEALDVAALEEQCEGNLAASSLAFRALSASEIAFQEKAWPMPLWTPYVPVIRGLIIKGHGANQGELVGILLWSPVVAVIAAFLTGVSEGVWSALAPAAAIAIGVTFMSSAQWSRFRQVVAALKRQHEVQ